MRIIKKQLFPLSVFLMIIGGICFVVVDLTNWGTVEMSTKYIQWNFWTLYLALCTVIFGYLLVDKFMHEQNINKNKWHYIRLSKNISLSTSFLKELNVGLQKNSYFDLEGILSDIKHFKAMKSSLHDIMASGRIPEPIMSHVADAITEIRDIIAYLQSFTDTEEFEHTEYVQPHSFSKAATLKTIESCKQVDILYKQIQSKLKKL